MGARDLRPRIGALAALAGGAAWAIKAVAILAAGWQPPVLFEVAAPFFLVALAGLHATVAPGTRGARVGLAALVGSALGLVAAGVAAALQPAWRPVDETLTPVGAMVLAAALLALASLGALGRRVQVERALPGPWRHLPMGLAIATLPLLALGGALADVASERLLELPLLGIALGWMALGVAMLRATRTRPAS